MAAYTKIPRLNIAATVGQPVGKITGVIASTGHKALDALEVMIADTREKSAAIKKEIQTLQAGAVQQAAALEREAVLKTNGILTEAATTAYESFLNKVLPGKTVAEVTVDISPTAAMLHQQARELLDRANSRVSDLIAENLKLSKRTLSVVDTSLKVVETSLTTVLTATKVFKTLIKTLRAPLTALKAAIIVIKAIPLPQRYLVVSFTILESDLLEMMEQLISQAEEEIRAIEAILSCIETALQPLRDRIRRIRALLALLKTGNLFMEASTSDLDILDQAGLFDKNTGTSLFDTIQDGRQGGGNWYPYGDIGDVNLTDPQVGDQILGGNPGDYIHWSGSASGSYVEDYYKWQVDQPPYPKGRPESEGWSRYPDRPTDRLQDSNERLWRLSLLETGQGATFGGFGGDILVEVPGKEWQNLFDTIERFKSIQAGVGNKSDREGEVVNYDPLTGYRYGADILLLGENNFDQKPGILKPSSWDALEIAALDKLRNLPLSDNLQNYLMDIWQDSAARQAGTSDLVDDAVAYRAANGELYYLRVKEDEHSPKVAVRRYVEVRDEGNVVILEGIKTFSLDKESLIKEMKIQLDQLTR